MAGIATTCKSNPETGRDGCGGPYRGRMSHCVAPAPWSTHADGLCHETFGAPSTFDMHWTKVGHVDPRTVAKLHQDERGIWKAEGPDASAVSWHREGGGSTGRSPQPVGG